MQRGAFPIWESNGASVAHDVWCVPAHLVADFVDTYALGGSANYGCAYLATSSTAQGDITAFWQ